MDNQNMNNGPVNYQPNIQGGDNGSTPALSIVGLILGIISIIICCCSWIGCLFALGGIICSVLGNKQNPTGIGKAGLICSIVGMVLGAAIFIFALVAGNGLSSNPEDYMEYFENM